MVWRTFGSNCTCIEVYVLEDKCAVGKQAAKAPTIDISQRLLPLSHTSFHLPPSIGIQKFENGLIRKFEKRMSIQKFED